MEDDVDVVAQHGDVGRRDAEAGQRDVAGHRRQFLEDARVRGPQPVKHLPNTPPTSPSGSLVIGFRLGRNGSGGGQ